jgi:pimeloyl-ACP methyl ester carboxylesterase
MTSRPYPDDMSDVRDLTLADGSTLQYFLDDGAPADAGLLVYHHGTPAAGPLGDDLVLPAREAGLRIVELVRPGYGGSTRQPGRTIADVVPLVTALADHLGHERFVSLGWSGGGPHVLATAALLPDRCAAALCLAGVAPYDAEGLDYLAGMGEDNIAEFGAALEGPAPLEAFLSEAGAALAEVTGPEVNEAMSSLLPEVDKAHLTGAEAEHLAAELRWSLSTGIWGWFDDDLAFVAPWGFDLASIRVPVQVWQGSADLMVPFAHGRWLAAHVPSAEPVLAEGEGHLSLVPRIGEGMATLRAHLDS